MSDRLDNDDLGPSVQRRAFKQQLTKHMAALRITAAELSRRTGLSKDAISSYNKMRSLPTEETLAKLAKVLKCKPEALLQVGEEGADPTTLVEIREYSKPGYKLLVARVPIPVDVVADLFSKLMAYAEPPKRK